MTTYTRGPKHAHGRVYNSRTGNRTSSRTRGARQFMSRATPEGNNVCPGPCCCRNDITQCLLTRKKTLTQTAGSIPGHTLPLVSHLGTASPAHTEYLHAWQVVKLAQSPKNRNTTELSPPPPRARALPLLKRPDQACRCGSLAAMLSLR